MARAPFQGLVFPYARAADGTPRYAVFRRADLGVWQGLAGGGEEGGVPVDAAWVRLAAAGWVPASASRDRGHWRPA